MAGSGCSYDVEKIQIDYMTMIDLSHPYPIPIHSHETPRFLGQVMIPFGRTQNSGRIEGSDVLMWNDPLNANHGVWYIYLHGPTILGDFEGKC